MLLSGCLKILRCGLGAEDSAVKMDWGGGAEARDLESFHWGFFWDGFFGVGGAYFGGVIPLTFPLGVVFLLATFLRHVVRFSAIEAEFLFEAAFALFF